MIVRFKSEEAMNKFAKIGGIHSNNNALAQEYGMTDIKIDRIDDEWWDIVDPVDWGCIFTINISDESQYFDIISE